MYGTPENWFGGHGWQVVGVENGECWEEITKAYYNILVENPDPSKPKIVYCKTRKGRGHLKYDFHSHGSPHEMNSNLFWETKKEFVKKYGVNFENFGKPASRSREGNVQQATSIFNTVFSVMRDNTDFVKYLSDRLIGLGDSIPEKIDKCIINPDRELKYQNLFHVDNLPDSLFEAPGNKVPNREGFSKYASYINSLAEKN